MKIKRFKAKTFSEALELVKKELGEEAIVLSTEEKKGLRGFVEVTAAIDYDNQEIINTANTQADLRKSLGTYITPEASPNPAVSEIPISVKEIKTEIEKLRETIEVMKNNGYDISLPAKKRMMLNFLRERAIREEFALRICERSRDLSDIADLITADIDLNRNIEDQNKEKKAVMLIGPTGVGKTTTIAKLAAKAIKDGKRVAIINLDTYRIGAPEQIRIYSRIMGIPLSIASNANDLRKSLLNFLQTKDIVFIDTTGRNPANKKYIKDMEEIISSSNLKDNLNFTFELQLLMSANSDDEFMINAYKYYQGLPINYLAFTKIDEAVRFGQIYNIILVYQRPVAYITTGQQVPDDIEFSSPKNLADLILQKGSYKC